MMHFEQLQDVSLLLKPHMQEWKLLEDLNDLIHSEQLDQFYLY